MPTLPWVLASRNAGKLRELRSLFATRGIDVVDLREVGVVEEHDAEEAIESFETFEENALAKARYFSRLLPGRVVVADDSGLAVDALGGAPGVRSKRWSAAPGLSGSALVAANNAKLVAALGGAEDRSAHFVCAAAWSDGERTLVVRGEVPGHFIDSPRGTHGFGYDPHFFVDELGMTMAEATVAEKEAVSHRGRAFVMLLEALRGASML
jgi:XTP/dITP diphosphohydrolase